MNCLLREMATQYLPKIVFKVKVMKITEKNNK